MGNSMFRYRLLHVGEAEIPVLHPDSREVFFKYNLENRIVARTSAALVIGGFAGKAIVDPETLWVVDSIAADPEYASGFKARGVSYLTTPESTEVVTEYTPWLDLDWFVPLGANYGAA